MNNLTALLEKVDSMLVEAECPRQEDRGNLREKLHRYFGLTEFRPVQEEIIANILKGKNVFAILPTGYGKSLCYQLPALLLDGVTLIISPLIALMKDQVDKLKKLGINEASYINSLLSIEKQRGILEQMKAGRLKLVYISPERFRSRLFLNYLSQLQISLFVIDEAHCISQWGHDFRPDYLALSECIEKLHPCCIAAFTATATEEVQADIIKRINLGDFMTIVQSVQRDNLKFNVITVEDDEDKLRKIAEFISMISGKGIIYTGRTKEAEFVSSFLQSIGLKAAFYHGQMDTNLKEQIQESFMSNDGIDIVAATCAFGLGIDKGDIRFVIHYTIPGSIEAYLQEAGRAGRDGKEAFCLLLYQNNDRNLQEWFIKNSLLSKKELLKLLKVIEGFDGIRNLRVIEEPDLEWMSGFTSTKLIVGISFLEKLGFIKRYPNIPKKIKVIPLKSIHDPLIQALITQDEVDLLAFCQGTNGVLPADLYNSLLDAQFERLVDFKSLTNALYLELTNTSKVFESISERQFGIEEINAIKYKKLDQMMIYALTKGCRTNHLKRYFGEKVEDRCCNTCDNCLREKESVDIAPEDLTFYTLCHKTTKMENQKRQEIERFIEESRSPVLTGNFDKGIAIAYHSKFVVGKRELTSSGRMVYLFKYAQMKGKAYEILDEIEDFFSATPQMHEFLDVDYIIPVPATVSQDRDYDPMVVLSEVMAKRFGLVAKLDILIKIRQTYPQKDMKTKEQKRRNVLGAFATQESPNDKKILLIDDLYDSGMTMNECAKVLKQAGATKVYALALTKTIHV